MGDSLKTFANSVWFKIVSLGLGFLFTLVTSYGVYHLNKLDSLVKEMQSDKIELIDRINTIDRTREANVKHVKVVMNDINTTLKTFIAKTDANKFTSKDGLEVWREISTIKQQIVNMERDIANQKERR